MSPFVSEKQRKYLFKKKPEVARKFASHGINPNDKKYTTSLKNKMNSYSKIGKT